MDVIITLAGKSERFLKEGYKIPKFLLNLGKYNMIQNVMNMFDGEDKYHLVFSNSQFKKYRKDLLKIKNFKKRVFIYNIEDHNLGPAHTALHVKNIPDENEVIVSYCDFLVSWNYKKFKMVCRGYDGSLLTFRGFHPSSFSGTYFCYLKSKNSLIEKISEKKPFTKKPHNEYAATGIHYFNTFRLFKKATKDTFKSKSINKKYKEIYMSLPYINLLKEKKNILNFEVDNFICLGTPKDYEEFMSWKNYFLKSYK